MNRNGAHLLADSLGSSRLQGLRQWAATGASAVGSLVFPPFCPLCGGGGPHTFDACESCAKLLREAARPACPRCGLLARPGVTPQFDTAGCPHCRGRAIGFDAAFALVTYEEPFRTSILRLKSWRSAWLAPTLIALLLEHRGEALRAWVSATAPEAPPCIVPVPLHWLRRLRRGYNQADALAAALARALGWKLRRVLKRIRHTRKLADLSRTERALELRGSMRARRPLAGRDVLLVDDVMTTGATCGAAARALKRAGARRVAAVVIGRAGGSP